jgi:peptide chain release factor 2
LTSPVEAFDKLTTDLADASELASLIESPDSTDASELNEELARLDKVLAEWEFQTMLGGEDDPRNCILTIHAGAGGTESADWAAMLMRMYLRYLERRKFKGEVIDLQPGDQAGIKSASIEIEGEYAYGRMKAESGVHRLVRISPFDSNARRHTSFASVFVFPEVEEGGEIQINPADLRVDTFRASGAGGQHINKTDSAIRITHIPTGIVVTCQSDRSQHRNRDSAMRYLMARLLKLRRDEEAKKRDVLDAQKADIAWGSQIRSYVLHPYRMVKDLRTNVETSDTDGVLDGDLERFIEAYLMGVGKGE